ncbi:hypothetical protein BDN72DRAFT_829991 [Pluteus cervinus]|uniref:Uncharacterized protein n=1 Tax=Pluteus cervinus TaxID=181527 RepID=A0ACD3BFL3_9AGAR|nr:hypothetical protein BDN72DRAFT_829991 [Pluteus cervinus]
MNSISSPYHPSADYSSSSRHPHEPELRHALSSAFNILDQPPPPTLREILAAYRSKGDGDRDMLLAMLNAKAAEDQRLASYASLRRSVLEVYQTSAPLQPSNVPRLNGAHPYPTPSFTQSPQLEEQRPSRSMHLDAPSRSPSPRSRRSHPYSRDSRLPHEPPSKRPRVSHSPPSTHHAPYDSHPEQLPPSPYSSSGRSDSAEYSPRTRASMAIGSLLSSGPNKDSNTDES